jgi:glyoxylase-like metal-dependent hydrolase (beta-lactamase superfamily II)
LTRPVARDAFVTGHGAAQLDRSMFKKPVKAPSGALSYPFDALDPGAARPLADGVVWARLAAPGRIGHVNVYLLRDGDGWTLVDTGAGVEAVEEQLAFLLDRELEGAPLVRVIATHMHPAQVGQAGLVCRRHGAPLWTSRLEYLSARVFAADRPPPPQEAIDFLLAAGWKEAWLTGYRERYGGYGRALRALPPSFTRIEDRDDVLIDGRIWRVITGEGHSPEHVCLWQPDLKMFISGDQVLPMTESVVSVWPTEPGGDPLNDWLTSCWRIMAAIPEDVLVLPSRDVPFYGLHARLDQIILEHQSRLERLKTALDKPKRVVDLMRLMHQREPHEAERLTFTGETLAHLNYLKRKGRVSYALDEAGVAWFELDPNAEEEEDELEAL